MFLGLYIVRKSLVTNLRNLCLERESVGCEQKHLYSLDILQFDCGAPADQS